jgi:hypothetical protein
MRNRTRWITDSARLSQSVPRRGTPLIIVNREVNLDFCPYVPLSHVPLLIGTSWDSSGTNEAAYKRVVSFIRLGWAGYLRFTDLRILVGTARAGLFVRLETE